MTGLAYDGAAWAAGPSRVYGILAGLLLDHAPALSGALLLDAGAGTGAVSSVATARGCRVVAVDLATSMLAYDRARRPPAVAGSVDQLPLRDSTFDLAVAAFCLGHVASPVVALGELRRVVRPGGAVLVSVFARGAAHPAKDAVHAALHDLGWRPPPWYASYKADVEPVLGDPDRLAALASSAGLAEVSATVVTPRESLDDPDAIVAWRLGMAHTAPFVAGLAPAVRAGLSERLVAAVTALGQPVRLPVVVLSARRAA